MALFTLSHSVSSRPWFLKTSSSSSSFFQTTSLSSSSSSLSISLKTQIPICIKVNSNNTSISCSAAKQQKESSVKKKRNTTPKKKGFLKKNEFDDSKTSFPSIQSYQPASLPKPPAGFVLDPNGNVALVSSKRIVTIVDSTVNLPLECVIRRVFRSSKGDDCMLLCPVDTPVQVLKSTNAEGWSAVSDDEVEAILPAAAYALAKIHMHLVHSGFCYTARGGFCYVEEDIFEFETDNGQDVEGVPTEGVQITCFHQDSTSYMIYTPSDPLLFVAVKDSNGLLRIAEDDLLEDSAIVDALDEETEFNALVEEEAALLESLLGELE
ncbi:hypothetical protein AQUCO_01400266v1 [Aquilegia coerulea]|uniref:Uncharacterized protein n=1 Tax=Aquilegia coerulea TaxID=218851 RepID=A0A2G5DVF4_AQUCA|nr:hypothetical protein AQUCO_01400266v1 [Aquilegia coerulea]